MPTCMCCGEASAADLCPPCAVRHLRIDLGIARAVVERIEVALKAAEKLAGCRPGDGSDQPGLFEVAQPSLFGE